MYFIRDCNDQIVGNPKGYRTFRGANQQAHSTRSKVNAEIWARFYAKRKVQPDCYLINRIKNEGDI